MVAVSFRALDRNITVGEFSSLEYTAQNKAHFDNGSGVQMD